MKVRVNNFAKISRLSRQQSDSADTDTETETETEAVAF